MTSRSRLDQHTAQPQTAGNTLEAELAARGVSFTVTATRNLALLAENSAILLTDFASTILSADITVDTGGLPRETSGDKFSICNPQSPDTFFDRFFAGRDRMADASEALIQARCLQDYARDLRALADVAEYGPDARAAA